MLDGTHVRIDRSGDKDRHRADYSGKKAFTLNTNVLTDARKRILWINGTAPGSTHDLTLRKKDPLNLGILTRIMSSDDTPEPDRPALYVDKGYQSISGYYQARPYGSQSSAAPTTTDTGELTEKEPALNKENNGMRVVVEHAIGTIKRCREPPSPSRARPRGLTASSTSSPGW